MRLIQMPIPRLLLFLAILYGGSASRAQSAFQTQALTVADGLSQGYVSCLFEDRRGFIWIGTFNGLNRYDGYEVKRFTPDNTGRWALKANFIHTITEDAQGLLWIGTDKGPVIMDPYTERFIHLAEFFPEMPANDVVSIIPAADGRIWLCHRQSGTNGASAVQPPANLLQLIREGRPGDGAFHIQSLQPAGALKLPFVWMVQVQDSILLVFDAADQLCRIDTHALTASRIDPRALPYERFGEYGLLTSGKDGRGLLFQLKEVPNSHIGHLLQMAPFLTMPGELRVLLPEEHVFLYELDSRSPGLEIPGYGRWPFFRQFKPFAQLDHSLSGAGIVDCSGNLWVGTNGYGVRKISPRRLPVERYLPQSSVYNFSFLPDGRIWPGLYCQEQVLNRAAGQLEKAPWKEMLADTEWVYCLLNTHAGGMWLAVAGLNGVNVLKKERDESAWTKLPLHLTKYQNVPIQMLEGRSGFIWVAGNRGEIIRIDPHDNQKTSWNISHFFPDEEALQLRSTCLVEDARGTLWIGSNFGLVQVSRPDGEPEFSVFHNHSSKGPIFKSDWILGAYPDPQTEHVLWLGTRGGGLIRFNYQTLEVDHFTEKDGLSNNVVYGIVPDSFGYLWMSTNRGLCRFNPRNRTFANFQQADPAINTEFNTGAYASLPTGELAFGSVEGLFFLRPPNDKPSGQQITVAVTDININGQPLDFPCEDGCLQIRPDQSFALRLPYDQNNVAIMFAALQTADPSLVQYRYRVSGLSKHWVTTGNQRSANLVGLPDGRYVLELQAKTPDDEWENAPATCLYLTIRPPWYRSWFAYLLYFLMILLLIRIYIRFVRKRLALEHAIALNTQEMEQLKTLDDFKNRFFSYISHEFKTPLTIILGLAERLRQGATPGLTPTYASDIIQQGSNMLELVDQLIDITRLEERQLHLHWQQGNLSAYIRYLVESYRPLASFRDIDLKCSCDTPDIHMDFDPQRLKYILNNLLTNSIRHTPAGGTIRVRVSALDGEFARLEVSDTGEGISAEDMPHIFERYFRGRNGEPTGTLHFGLGLAFVRELVYLFNGTIGVSSQPGQGTNIAITLPVRNQAPPFNFPIADPNPAQTQTVTSEVRENRRTGLPQLLVVEDNPVISNFLQICLRPHFQLKIAADGLSGWEQALRQLPDLVLTDVMLPGIDGLELTHRIKSHELTNHIPVVILSARAELEDRLSGQRLGADAYLAKPFHEHELILVLQNLYNLQRRWQERFAQAQQKPTAALSPDELNQPEDRFLTKLYAVFEKNYMQESYGLPQLCRDLEISKSQLQRKLAVLAGQSAMELLRHYRLQKAYALLQAEPHLNVKEVCFRVGFKDPAHFSRLFTKTFRQSPSSMRADTL